MVVCWVLRLLDDYQIVGLIPKLRINGRSRFHYNQTLSSRAPGGKDRRLLGKAKKKSKS